MNSSFPLVPSLLACFLASTVPSVFDPPSVFASALTSCENQWYEIEAPWDWVNNFQETTVPLPSVLMRNTGGETNIRDLDSDAGIDDLGPVLTLSRLTRQRAEEPPWFNDSPNMPTMLNIPDLDLSLPDFDLLAEVPPPVEEGGSMLELGRKMNSGWNPPASGGTDPGQVGVDDLLNPGGIGPISFDPDSIGLPPPPIVQFPPLRGGEFYELGETEMVKVVVYVEEVVGPGPGAEITKATLFHWEHSNLGGSGDYGSNAKKYRFVDT